MTDKVMGRMVFCVSCKSVVWAHDSDLGDVRGICNVFRLSCPECGDVASFDGYTLWESWQFVDVWAEMHRIAEQANLTWRNSPDLSWGGRQA